MAVPAVMSIINSFREGKKDVVTRPLWMKGHRSLIQYYALRDVNGHYLGTIEFTGSVEYILNLFEQGAWDKDANTGASQSSADASTGASETSGADEDDDQQADASTGASETGSVDADDQDADASTGASETDDE